MTIYFRPSKKHNIVCETGPDLISNLPDIVTDKILKRLPFHMVVQMSTLSKHWRQKWLSLKTLVFDRLLYKRGSYNWEKWSNIISNVLLHHNGPIYNFCLYVPDNLDEGTPNINQWLSFLSKNCVKKIMVVYCYESVEHLQLHSHIFFCPELVKLKLMALYLGSPTSEFKGFTNLRSLELFYVDLAAETFTSITMNCPHLAFIKLYQCTGMKHLVIDVPGLKSLVIEGYFKSLEIKNGQHLVNISLNLEDDWWEDPSTGTVKTIKTLADSYELQRLHFGDGLFMLLSVSGFLSTLPMAFNHLDRLCLTAIDLRDVDVFHVTIGMIQSCPCIKELDIECKRTWCESSLQDVVIPSRNNSQHKIDCNADYKLCHLRKVKIRNISGHKQELKFIEYILAISVVLERLFYKLLVHPSTELMITRELRRLPRASPKAQLIYSERLSIDDYDK